MKKRLDRKKYILATMAVVVVAIVAIVVGIITTSEPVPDAEYFVSDETKLVMSLTKDMAAFEESAYEAPVTRIVYYHDGENITSARVYFDYNTEDDARVAYDNISMKDKDWTTARRLIGHYVVFETTRAKYDGLTVEQVRKNIEDMRAVNGLAE